MSPPRDIFFPSCDLTMISVLSKQFTVCLSANIRMPAVDISFLVVMVVWSGVTVGWWLLGDKSFPYPELGLWGQGNDFLPSPSIVGLSDVDAIRCSRQVGLWIGGLGWLPQVSRGSVTVARVFRLVPSLSGVLSSIQSADLTASPGASSGSFSWPLQPSCLLSQSPPLTPALLSHVS